MVGWCTVTAVALMLCAGCAMFESGESQNEVLRTNYSIVSDGHIAINIEQANGSTDNASKTVDVYVLSAPLLQAYRIEGRKVSNCRWVEEGEDIDWVDDVHPFALWNRLRELPNKLEQKETQFHVLVGDSVVSVTTMGWGLYSPPPDAWGGFWTARQWAGTSDEVPAFIEAFRQTIVQAVSTPKHRKKYRSYLRAVPLFTEADLEAEKNTPLIDLRKTGYHVQCSTQYPYLLIPVSWYEKPFPVVRNYTPGDKFKVQYYDSDSIYFLIETFRGK